MDHSIVKWIQIPTLNIKRAATFYENVFNASFFFEELNDISHAVFKVGENGKKLLNGALIKVDKNSLIGLGTVLFFDATGNFENILDRIQEYGGSIVKKKTLITRKESENSYIIPNTYIDDKPGYYAHFLDSEGNRMGLYGTN